MVQAMKQFALPTPQRPQVEHPVPPPGMLADRPGLWPRGPSPRLASVQRSEVVSLQLVSTGLTRNMGVWKIRSQKPVTNLRSALLRSERSPRRRNGATAKAASAGDAAGARPRHQHRAGRKISPPLLPFPLGDAAGLVHAPGKFRNLLRDVQAGHRKLQCSQ